ncbi:MAG: bacterial Ig-like domain-containing protein, partial [Clostridia bacterium]|nr:bacterial Ig-like domain-containing protein [Clostridia bacterium]
MIKYNKFLVILILLFCLIILFACGEATVSPVSSIVITNLPQTEYFLGDDLNLNDAQVTVIYDNNSSTIIPITREMISGFDSNVVGKQTLTVTYENVYSFFTVNVIYPPIYSISFVNTENYKKNYVVGESLDINNLFIIANYSNGYTSKVNVTNEMISGFDSSIIGTKTLSITYSGKVCTFSIDVNEKIIVNTQLVAPTKNSYVVGDDLDLTGGKIFIAYNDNSHVYLDLKVLDDNNEITINCLNFENDLRRFKNDMLTTSVNVLYKTYSFSFNVTVSQLKISSVDIKKYPDDLIVYQKNIDVSSGVITVVYNNSTSKDMNLDDECIILDLSNIDINSINIVDGYNFEIKVLVNPNNPNNYVSKECNVKVVQSTPEELIIIPSTSLKYYQGTNLDFSTWKYKIRLNNDQFNILPSSKTDEDFVSNEMVDLNNINVNKVGKQIVRFVYVLSNNSRLVKDVEIEILQKTITNIYVSTNYNHVYEQGDAFNFSSLLLNVEYNDNTIEENISVTIDMLKDRNQIQIESLTDLTNEVSSSDFNNYLFISYQDNRFNISSDVAFEYIVVKKCINIELRNEPKKKYVLNSDFLFDWEVYVEYIDGTGDFFTQDDLKDSIWTFENIDFSSINTYQVKLMYAHSKFIEYEINVTNNIILEGFKDSFIGFINEGININSNTLLYDVLEDLSVKESTISLFDFT